MLFVHCIIQYNNSIKIIKYKLNNFLNAFRLYLINIQYKYLYMENYVKSIDVR